MSTALRMLLAGDHAVSQRVATLGRRTRVGGDTVCRRDSTARAILLVMLFATPSVAQQQLLVGDPVVRNFAPTDYQASGQNWSMLQDANGILYVGNSDGLLEFDGARWQRLETSRRSSVRSLTLDGRGRIHAAGLNDIGYFEPDQSGQLQFHSRASELSPALQPLGDVFTVVAIGDDAYYRAGSRLLHWSPSSAFEHYPAIEPVSGIADIGNAMVAHTRQGQLWRLAPNAPPHPLAGGMLRADRLVFALPHRSGLLLGTYDAGLFVYDGAAVRPFAPGFTSELKSIRPYSAARLSNGEIAVGTTVAGVLVFTDDGTLVRRIRQNAGLRDDSVLSTYVDRRNGLWVGTTDGLSRVEYPSPLSQFGALRGLPGIIVDVARHDGRIWAATARGVYRSLIRDNRTDFERAPLSGLQCWRLWPTEAGLLSACTGAVEVVEDRGARLLSTETVQALQRPSRWPQIMLGAGVGIALFKLEGGHWSAAGSVPHFTATVRYLAEDSRGDIWAGSLAGELYRLRLSGSGPVPEFAVTRYGRAHGLPEGPIDVHTPGGTLIVRTGDGLMQAKDLDAAPEAMRFERITNWPDLPSGFRRVLLGRNVDSRGRVWLTRQDGLVMATRNAAGVIDFGAPPVVPIPATGNNVIVVDSDAVWIGRQNGLFRLQASGESRSLGPLSAMVRRVVDLESGTVLLGNARPGAAALATAANVRSLRFEFSAPSFAVGVVYQTRLDGFDKSWSAWDGESSRVYTNLPGGKYTFHVRARTGNGQTTGEAVLPLTIEQSWLERWYVQLGLVLALAVAAVSAGRGVNRIRLRRLSEVVRARTSELADTVTALREQTRAAEQARAAAEHAERARAAFVAAVSHEVRAPLSGVIGMTSLLQSTALDEEQASYVDTIRSSGDALLATINDILDYSKLEAGRLELQPAAFALRDPIDDALQVAAPAAAGRGLRLLACVGADVPPVIVADPDRFRQIVVNLVSNAVKYTDRGSVRVRVKALAAAPTGQFDLSVEVIDSGVGIPADEQERLFHAFNQLTQRRGGTGLGLSICRQLTEAMGGRIWVESVEGVGSTFTFVIPVTAAPPIGVPHRLDGHVLIACADAERSCDLQGVARRLGLRSHRVPDVPSLAAALSDEPSSAVIVDEALAMIDAAGLATLDADRVVLLRPLERAGAAKPAWAGHVLTEPVRETRLVATLETVITAAAARDAARTAR